jgi:hypothetical protein
MPPGYFNASVPGFQESVEIPGFLVFVEVMFWLSHSVRRVFNRSMFFPCGALGHLLRGIEKVSLAIRDITVVAIVKFLLIWTKTIPVLACTAFFVTERGYCSVGAAKLNAGNYSPYTWEIPILFSSPLQRLFPA